MKFKYQLLMFISILAIVLGMGPVSAEYTVYDSALNDAGIDDSSISTVMMDDSAVDSSYESVEECSVSVSESSSSDKDVIIENNKLLSDESYPGDSASSLKVSKKNVLSGGSDADLTYHVCSDNYTHYFNSKGVLRDEFTGSILVFDGLFENKGVLTINKENTRVLSNGSQLINTVFKLNASGVVLANFNFTLDKAFSANNYAGIYVGWDNITVFNNTVNYFCPMSTCYGIYANDNQGLNLINNTVNFNGQGNNSDYYYYAVYLNYCYDAFVSGNDINAVLPLCTVLWGNGIDGGARMDKVAAFVAEGCDNLQLLNNNIYSTINGASGRAPTLSSVFIYACDNSTIDGNNITVEDFYTRKGTANFLYALDMYKLNNVRVLNNYIDVFTYGGKNPYGTAYPIQISGPAYNIMVAYNYLHSVSNGPNIGIYSQNFYGATQIDIVSNYINITGNASTHQWALVAGIEVQDSDDRILNNTIIVDTVGGYKAGDHVYGISYAQNTGGNHKYEIKYNNVTVPGAIAISLNHGLQDSTTSDTNVMYNILNTAVGEGGDHAVAIGGRGTNNVIRYNTNGSNPVRHMSDRDLPDWYLNSPNHRGSGFSLFWISSDSGSNSHAYVGNGSGGYGSSLSGNGKGNGFIFDSDSSGNNSRFSRSNSTRGDLNSTRYAVGDSGLSLAAASSSAGSGDGSSVVDSVEKNAYEIDERENLASKSSDSLQLALICIAALFLLVIGYKREKDKEEEE
ncbi:MAG TPA: hypothetical protein HA255_04960 [Methanosphaera sp.]|nr:MAG: hypothetical protein BZ133_08565 [Methanosphaera sp. SHI613]HIH35783.1 hypothetical protein [Methanosphaera sp.]